MWELDSKESWAPKNWRFWAVVLEKTLESPFDCKKIQLILSVHWKDWCWTRNSYTLATWYEELTYLKRPWCCGRLKAGREGEDRRWDGWMASPTRWTWVWVRSGSRWWTGKPGVLQSMGSQRVIYDWATELNGHVDFLGVCECSSLSLIYSYLLCPVSASSLSHTRRKRDNGFLGFKEEEEFMVIFSARGTELYLWYV